MTCCIIGPDWVTTPVPVRCINAAAPNATNLDGNRRFAPGFDAVIVEDVGHWIMLERPEELLAQLRLALAAFE